MKILKIKKISIFLILFMLGLCSCSDNDPAAVKLNEELILGKWNVTKEILLDSEGNMVVEKSATSEGRCPLNNIRFFDDNRYVTSNFHWEKSTRECTIHAELKGYWVIDGNKVYMERNDFSSPEFTIVTLNKKKFIFEFLVNEDVKGNYPSNISSVRIVLKSDVEK